MRFPQPLQRGRLVARYKRFFADVVLDGGDAVTAHVANPGKMLGLLNEGAVCWLSRTESKTRKLPWTLEIMEEPATGALVGVNTAWPNRLAESAIAAGRFAELAGYDRLRREARYGANSRIDLLLEADERPPCWVEIKSVTLSRAPGLAEWPDCVSSRTTRQLADLQALVEAGQRAVILFLAQRSDCARFAPAADIDPDFAATLGRAQRAGVEVLCYSVTPTPLGFEMGGSLETPPAAPR